MAEFDQAKLEAAITGAITAGFAKIKTDGGTNTSTISPGTPPRTENNNVPLPDPKDIQGANKGMQDLENNSTSAMEAVKTTGAGITGFLGGMMQALGKGATTSFNQVASLNEELDKEVSYFRLLQERYGGISESAYAAGEAVEGIGGQALRAEQHLAMVGAAGADAALQIGSGAMKGKNALVALFKEPEEAAHLFLDALETVNHENINVAKSLEQQGKAEQERIAIIMKRMGVSANQMGDMLKRQYAFTGEASAGIFEDIANVSVALAKTTGGSAEDLKSDILDIMDDVDKFGNIGVDAAGRIAGALNQLGLDFNTFDRMTQNFMNFDSAAGKMGELSALFGIQMDAMEMTYLANEDQEEFLFRMREEILDAGLDVENMSKTRQRALADQLGMNVVQMQQYMREGELTADQAEMTAATESAETMDGMATAVEQFGGAYEGAYRGAAQFEKSLRIQATYTDQISRDIIAMRAETGTIPGSTNEQLKLSDAARKNAITQLKLEKETLMATVGELNPMLAKFATIAGEYTAEAGNVLLETVGLTAESGKVKVEATVQTEASESQNKLTQDVIDAQTISTEREAANEVALSSLADNQLILQSENQKLVEAVGAEKTMPVTIQLHEGKFGDRLFNVMQKRFGRFVIQNNE